MTKAKLIPSGQYASRGFIGASTTMEFGAAASPWFGLVGLGRTNTKPYYNLNFGPNDSLLIGTGWTPDSASRIWSFAGRPAA